MPSRRGFLKTAAAAGAAAMAAPAVRVQSRTRIKWRLQTYAGAALAEHVVKPSVEAFNRAANGEMEIALYLADQLAPTGELFRAMRSGAVDAAQSDDESIGSPADVAVFGGYFPFACRHSLDVPALFHQWGLADVWREAYGEVEGVVWLGAGAWDPCHFVTVRPIRRLDDLKGLRVFTFPTAGRFLARFGVVPVSLPAGEAADAARSGRIDGIAWSGITEAYAVGWADAASYFLTNSISGAWCGSYFASAERWRALPAHLQELFRLCMDSSHYYRQRWYWGGEARLRVEGKKLALTSIPDAEWSRVEAEARRFWDEIAAASPRRARVVKILRAYNAAMDRAGPPYRCG